MLCKMSLMTWNENQSQVSWIFDAVKLATTTSIPMSLTYNFVVYVWQEASMWADDLITNKQTFDTWQKIPL